MFAVPGWSVPAEALKTQSVPRLQPAQDNSAQPKASKKRKHGHGQPNEVVVTDENLAELWGKYIEGKTERKSHREVEGNEKRKRKKRRKDEDLSNERSAEVDGDSANAMHEAGDGLGRAAAPVKKAKGSQQQISKNGTEHTPTEGITGGQAPPSRSELSGKAKYEERIRRKQENAASKASTALAPPESSPPTVTNNTRQATMDENSIQKDNSKSTLPPAINTKKPTPQSPSKKPPPQPPTTNGSSQNPTSKPKPQIPKDTTAIPTSSPPPTSLIPSSQPQVPLPNSKLTPLQRTMAAKLLSSRFRHLNQTLYTTPSTSAFELFTRTPSAYEAYHAGFRAQVAVWPENPVEGFIAELKTRGKARRAGLGAQKAAWRVQKKGKAISKTGKIATDSSKKGEKEDEDQGGEPLPRTGGSCHIADLGCGDANLAASSPPPPRS